MTGKTWNIGIIGSGTIAAVHAQAIKEIPNAHLAGFCDNGSGRSGQLAMQYHCKAYENYRQMLHDPAIDIVIIATPSGMHMQPAIDAAYCKKHVLCEKPMEITPSRIDKMIEAHEKNGTYLGGIFNFRYNEAIPHVKKAIDSGRMGVLTYAAVYIPWWRSDEYYGNSWRGTWQWDGGGALMNQGIHMVDILQYLMGPVKKLQAYTATLGHRGIETEDTAVCILQFANHALGYIYATTASFPGRFRQLEITGTQGTIVMKENSITEWTFDTPYPDDDMIRNSFAGIEGGGGTSNPAAISHINHRKNIEAFIHAIEEQKPFDIDGKEARKAVEIICQIYRAAGKHFSE